MSGVTVKSEIISIKELVEELQKPIIKFKKRKVHSFFIGNIYIYIYIYIYVYIYVCVYICILCKVCKKIVCKK